MTTASRQGHAHDSLLLFFSALPLWFESAVLKACREELGCYRVPLYIVWGFLVITTVASRNHHACASRMTGACPIATASSCSALSQTTL